MKSSLRSDEFKRQWSSLHGDAETKGIVGVWLGISYRCALILCRLRIGPNSLTALGVVFGAATAFASPSLWAAAFLAVSLACDGIDGSVALVSGKTTKLGAILDAIADRLTEAFWAVAFYRLGVPLSVVLFFSLLAGIQEYARARIGAGGVKEVGVVTPAERPVRASFLFVALAAWQFDVSNGWTTSIAELMALLQLVSLIMVIRFAYRALK